MKKFFILLFVMSILAVGLVGCETDAYLASKNLSKAADMFEVDRRVVFVNGITGQYLLSIEGKCSLTDQLHQLEVTCKTAHNQYKKHFLGLSDNVTYFAEQLKPVGVSVYRYRVIFKPTVILPDVDISVPKQSYPR